MRAEALAMEECMRGAGVCRTWSEQEMLCSFGGKEVPGTPDFMYEDAHGVLTCGQVVRVPILPGMTRTLISETIYCTVLAKLVKSQVWMKSCYIVPQEFIIFLWLPFIIHRRRKRLAEALASQVQSEGWPFHLRFAVPEDSEALFPSMFALCCKARSRRFSEADLAHFDPQDFEEEEEAVQWDIFAFEEGEDSENSEEFEENMGRADEYETSDPDDLGFENDEPGGFLEEEDLEDGAQFPAEAVHHIMIDIVWCNFKVHPLTPSLRQWGLRSPRPPRLPHGLEIKEKVWQQSEATTLLNFQGREASRQGWDKVQFMGTPCCWPLHTICTIAASTSVSH